MAIGRADVPLSGTAKDTLGLEDYAEALSRFVQNCETPMTVGIQGEWGSGKTSLMNMVRAKLPAGLHVHWFNTWQYGALGDEDTLGLQLLSALAADIEAKHAKVRKGEWLRRALSRGLEQPGLIRALASGALAPVGGSEAVDAAAVVFKPKDDAAGGTAQGLQLMRDELARLISEAAGPRSRFVIFVDDLDRIRPEHAVSLLEVLKNFLDVEHCVFVIACDYEVVRRGVEKKFDIQDAAKIRAFFDKIIQVPFQMPVAQYKVEGLLTEYLSKRGAKAPSALAAQLHPMVRLATGTNPRTFTRFLNVTDLMACLGEKQKIAVWRNDDGAVGLISLVALQTGWPEVTDWICGRARSERLEELQRILDLASQTEGGDALPQRLAEICERDEASDAWRGQRSASDLLLFLPSFLDGVTQRVGEKVEFRRDGHVDEWFEKLALSRVKEDAGLARGEARLWDERRYFDELRASGADEKVISLHRALFGLASEMARTGHGCLEWGRGGKYGSFLLKVKRVAVLTAGTWQGGGLIGTAGTGLDGWKRYPDPVKEEVLLELRKALDLSDGRVSYKRPWPNLQPDLLQSSAALDRFTEWAKFAAERALAAE